MESNAQLYIQFCMNALHNRIGHFKFLLLIYMHFICSLHQKIYNWASNMMRFDALVLMLHTKFVKLAPFLKITMLNMY